jgi:hypothetical protein
MRSGRADEDLHISLRSKRRRDSRTLLVVNQLAETRAGEGDISALVSICVILFAAEAEVPEQATKSVDPSFLRRCYCHCHCHVVDVMTISQLRACWVHPMQAPWIGGFPPPALMSVRLAL